METEYFPRKISQSHSGNCKPLGAAHPKPLPPPKAAQYRFCRIEGVPTTEDRLFQTYDELQIAATKKRRRSTSGQGIFKRWSFLSWRTHKP